MTRVCARPGCNRPLDAYRGNRRYCSDICRRAPESQPDAGSAGSVSALTQAERVLRLARLRGERGFTQIDFDLPGVTDGGTPIKRVAARVLELREQGYGIDSGERRQLCTVYRLTSEPVVEAPAVPACEVVERPPSQGGGDLDAGRLFDVEAA